MVIELFTKEDIPEFLSLAAAEGWISGAWELEFLLGVFPAGCFVCRDGATTVGLVTSVRYRNSGWVGNLIVRQDRRGRGIGSALFGKALQALADAGARTVWLTASDSGRPLYERIGFKAIDTVVRWEGRCRLGEGADGADAEAFSVMDAQGWGDRRFLLIREAAGRGPVSVLPGGFLVCQDWDGSLQLGPWAAEDAATAAALLGRAVAPSADGVRTFLDVPKGNGEAPSLLCSRGFVPCSATTLMYLGDAPAYVPGRIYALASMGSMG